MSVIRIRYLQFYVEEERDTSQIGILIALIHEIGKGIFYYDKIPIYSLFCMRVKNFVRI